MRVDGGLKNRTAWLELNFRAATGHDNGVREQITSTHH